MTSNRSIETPGVSVTYRNDFEKHFRGTDFRQDATSVDMNPQLPFTNPATNVQQTCERLYDFITNGADFVTLGDGNASFGTFTVGLGGYTTVEDCINAAIATLKISTRGGFILMKSGQYNFTTGVTIPAGVSIIGEGSTIINATTLVPPFAVQECPNYIIRASSVISADGYLINRFSNLTFLDNYGIATPALTGASSCFIYPDLGSNVVIENCSFMGKLLSTTQLTRYAIKYHSTVSAYNTSLIFRNNCIFGTQKALDFPVDTTKTNTLVFSHNRVWCAGIIGGSSSSDTSVISFRGCNAEFCNNNVMFGVSTVQNITSFIYCEAAPTILSTLAVTGNRVTATNSALLSKNNLIKFLSAAYFRSIIKDNTVGGSADSGSFYLVVGDGISNFGDINGTSAFSYIDSYFFKDNALLSTTQGQLTIYIKPGNYVITSGFATSADTFDFALIGLASQANLPRIQFSYAAPTTGGQAVYLGARLENIYFEGRSNLYNLFINAAYTQSNPSSRTIYFGNAVVKNCSFKNCGVVYYAASTANIERENNFSIEDCEFCVSSTLGNIDSDKVIAIRAFGCNSSINIKRCVTTKGQFYGGAVSAATTLSNYENDDIRIEDCVFYSIAQDITVQNLIRTSGFRNVEFVNNTIDLSTCASSDLDNLIYITASTRNRKDNKCSFTNNTIIGSSDATITTLNYAIYAVGIYRFICNNNNFESWTIPIYLGMQSGNSSTTIYPYNIEINGNKCYGGLNSYGFCRISTASSSNIPNGVVNISNNIIDMTLKSSSINRTVALNLYSIRSVIDVYAKNGRVNVNNNSIIDYFANYNDIVYQEAIISCINAKDTTISSNTITASNLLAARGFSSIYVGINNPVAAHDTTNLQSVRIDNNNIKHYDGVASPNIEYGIQVRDTHYVNITRNNIYNDNSYLTRYILVTGADTHLNIGSINDNTIDSSALTHITGASETIQYIDTAYASSALINIPMSAIRNRGHKTSKLIESYKFIQYGFNTDTDGAFPTPHDNKPYARATVLVNDSSSIFTNSHASNNNRTQLDIENKVATWGLIDGIYYTNAIINGYNPASYTGLIAGYWFKHQVLIPLDFSEPANIYSITIPIFWHNSHLTNPRTVYASASLICGNYNGLTEYIADDVANLWYLKSAVIAAGSNANTIMTHSTRTVLGTDFILNAQRRKATIMPNAYIVLNLSTSATVPEDYVFFAIPYAKITYLYA